MYNHYLGTDCKPRYREFAIRAHYQNKFFK